MKRLINTANEYVKKSDWKDLALIKLCLCAAGIMAGAALPKKAKKPVVFGAMAVFAATYVPLVTKFLHIFMTMPKPPKKVTRVSCSDRENEDWENQW